MKYIERTAYLDRLKGLLGTPDIKIITGIRRCGKSELLRAFIRYINEEFSAANIIFIDFYNLEFEELKNYKRLYTYTIRLCWSVSANF